MSYDSLVYEVMIASPADVRAERQIMRDVIAEWNAVNSRARSLVLLPVSWESHAAPSVGRPQGIVNKRVLETCDLLIAIFWTRLGTPTGHYESGTAEEIDKHVTLGKPAMLYFSDQGAAPSSLDTEQLDRLRAFKNRWRAKCLFAEYGHRDEFRSMFRRHLELSANQNPPFGLLERVNPNGARVLSSANAVLASDLPPQAKALLAALAKESDGRLILVPYDGGLVFCAGGQMLFGGSDRREQARWEDGLERLASIETLRRDGAHTFVLTEIGYRIAESFHDLNA